MGIKKIILILGFILGLLFAAFGYLFLSNQEMEVQNLPLTGIDSNFKNYTDTEYLRKMIIHHQDSVDLAKKAIENSSNVFVLEISKKIEETQTKEIEDMKLQLENIINNQK